MNNFGASKKSETVYKKMNSLVSAFHFYGVKLQGVTYLHESKIFLVGRNGYFELSRNEVNGFIRKYKTAKRAYVNQKILERV